jgi:hypothetical protein
MTAPLPLRELQQRFCAWLVEPDEDRAAQIAAPLGVGPGLVVYQNNYRVALVDALREIHPRAAAWLGEAAFAAAAARYIDADPPSSWTIDAYGAGFPAALRADDRVAGDLAAIDRAIGEAFVAADAVAADAGALAAVDWERAVIRPVPSLMRVPVTTNADALWLALVNNGDLPDAADRPGTVLVWRQGFEPVMRRADAGEVRMLEQSLDGASFAAICAGLAATSDESEAVNRAGVTLGRWLGEALIAGFD